MKVKKKSEKKNIKQKKKKNRVTLKSKNVFLAEFD